LIYFKGGNEMKMTIRKFLREMKNDIDVYNNVIDEDGIAYCPPVELTEDGEKQFQEVLNYTINVDVANNYAEVICDDYENIPWQRKRRLANELFFDLAGYCPIDDFARWFIIKED